MRHAARATRDRRRRHAIPNTQKKGGPLGPPFAVSGDDPRRSGCLAYCSRCVPYRRSSSAPKAMRSAPIAAIGVSDAVLVDGRFEKPCAPEALPALCIPGTFTKPWVPPLGPAEGEAVGVFVPPWDPPPLLPPVP